MSETLETALVNMTIIPEFYDQRQDEKSSKHHIMHGDGQITPALESTFVEGCILTWNFVRLIEWRQSYGRRLSIGNELLLCYALERLGQETAWYDAISRLRQRIFHNEIEYLCFRSLSVRDPKELVDIASEISAALSQYYDFIVEICAVRVADQLASRRQYISVSAAIYQLFSWPKSGSNWTQITQLKATMVAYLNGTINSDKASVLLRRQIEGQNLKTFALILILCFGLYLASVTPRPLDQSRMMSELRLLLKCHEASPAHKLLQRVSAYLLDPDQGLRIALRTSQFPENLSQVDTLRTNSPEMLWFDYCLLSLEEIRNSTGLRSVAQLHNTCLNHESSGNGLLAACARSKLLGIILRNELGHPSWHPELLQLKRASHSELQSFGALLESARNYRSGDFAACLAQLRLARRLSRDPCRRRIVAAWLDSARGRIPRQMDPELLEISLHMLGYFFGLSLRVMAHSIYSLSEQYTVDLSGFPVLNRLLQQLLDAASYRLTSESARNLVWPELSLGEGKQQKLRNTVSRLRYQFRFALLPLIIQTEGYLSLNALPIHIEYPRGNRRADRDQEILRILRQGPHTLTSLASIAQIPQSTLRRSLKRLQAKSYIVCENAATRQQYAIYPDTLS